MRPQWLDDIVWAYNMLRVRRIRRRLLFSRRCAFDRELCPRLLDARIAYPDAFYYVRRGDVLRAWARARRYLTP